MDQASEDRSNSFGVRLRRAREAAGLAQEELAARAGLSPNTVGGLERGEHRRPYPATVRALADALGLTDAERATLTAAMSAPGNNAAAPDAIPFGLPAPLAHLIGREREVEAVSALLRDGDTRLVTLTGPGGVGKTALALRVAADLSLAFDHGVAFVPLAAVRDPILVAPTVARALGLAETGDQSLPDRLRDTLRDRRLLLVLDNFEHLLDAAPLASDLLSWCPRLTVLATSRAPLWLAGERAVPVSPLAVSDPDRLPPTDELAGVAAIRLFVDRARASDPGFALSDENAGAVAALCHRLDGLPLAIELAAARSTVFTPAAMLPRLAQRLPLLVGGRRDAPARQRTLRDAIAWSHDLLTDEQQALFRRLAVFVGGFTLEAAEAVGAGEHGTRPDSSHSASCLCPSTLNDIAALVDHSLLRHEPGPVGVSRYRMLETIREYASERLAESFDEPSTRARHAAWFLELADRAEREMIGPDQIAWFHQLEAELSNLRSALGWLRDIGEDHRGLHLATALSTFWVVRDRVPEGRRWLETFMEAGTGDSAHRARALGAHGDLAERMGDYDVAAASLEDAIDIAQAAHDVVSEASALRIRGNVAISQGETARHRMGDESTADEEFDRAEVLLERSLDLAQESGDEWGVAKAKHWRSIVSLSRKDYVRATAELDEALALFRRIGDIRQICMVVGNLGAVAFEAGDLGRARETLIESLVLADELRYRWWIGWCLDNLSRVVAVTGEPERAARLLGAASALRPATGEPIRSGLERAHSELISTIREAIGAAATDEALAEGERLPLDAVISDVMTGSGLDSHESLPSAPGA